VYFAKRRWSPAVASSLILLTAFASGAQAAAMAPSAQRGAAMADISGGNGGNGTVSAKSGHNRKATMNHAAAAADATGDLSTVSSVTVHGGYTADGIGMRNLGHGTITVSGVPAGATVRSATLLWDVLADASDPSLASGMLDGQDVTGSLWASGVSPCWPVGSNFSYEADVTGLVTGNGSYDLAGFASGQTDGADPWNSGSAPPLLEGATLVVVYELSSMPLVDVQIAEGATETDSGAAATATLDGFTVGEHPAVTTTYIVADGQLPGNTASFDGNVLPGVGFPGADPQAAPGYSQGNLWDTVTADVSSYASAGDTSASVAVTGNSDCLVWVGQVLSVGTESVLGLGDSVAAGYGLGPSQGHPDNPLAYPAVLAGNLGASAENYAVEGACASASVRPDCLAQSVDWQIGQVPDDFTPSLVTLTVGADDIDFGHCIIAIMLAGDLSMQSPSDPCNPRTLAANLGRFQAALTTDLHTLADKYPGVPIEVMDYFNPFAPPPAAGHDACAINQVATLVSELAQHGALWVAERYLLHHGSFAGDARTFQARVYQDAQAVIGKLNAAIDSSAAGLAKVISTDDFAGHDMCAHGTEWVFSPTAAVDLTLQLGSFVNQSVHLSAGGDEVCPDPVPSSSERNFRFYQQLDLRSLHVFASVGISVGTNCVPHPTQAGQAAIAADFQNQGG
jgi:lysophospholipase L1-like esterase